MKNLSTRRWYPALFIISIFFCCAITRAQQVNSEQAKQQFIPPKTSDEVVKYIQEKLLTEITSDKIIQLEVFPASALDYFAQSHILGELWNGTAWQNFLQLDFTYNTQGWLTEAIAQQWSSGNWVNYARYINTYTGDGLIASQVTFTWGGSDWINANRYTYTYDSNGNRTVYLYENWNGSSWVGNYQYLYTYYTGTSNEKTEIYQTWSGGTWQNSTMHTYQYNSNDLMTEDLSQYWSGGSWVNNFKYTYTYLNDNVLNETVFAWTGSQWVNYYLYSYTYNASGLLTEKLGQNWDNVNLWVNDHLYSYTYDPSGNKTVEMRQDWAGSQWLNYYMYLYTYNASNQMVDQTYQTWNLGTGWENVNYYTYNYDSNGNQSMVVYQSWDGVQWVNMTRTTTTWISIVSDVAKEGIIKTYSLSNNYPNPFNPTTKISWQTPKGGWQTLKVYDVLGREVAALVNEYKAPGKYEIKFNAANLPSGIYIYRLKAGNFISAKKMLLLK